MLFCLQILKVKIYRFQLLLSFIATKIMYSPEDLPVVLVWHPEGSRGSRHEFLFIVDCVINKIITHGKKLLQIFSFLSDLYSLNADGSSGAANPPSHALHLRYVSHPFMSSSFLCCYLVYKVKWSRYRPGVAQRVGRGLALLFHDRGTRRGWVVSSTPRPQFTPGKDPVPILREVEWAPGSVWTVGKSRSHRDSIPDLPALSSVSIPTYLPGPCYLVRASLNYRCDKTVFLIIQMLLPIVAEYYSLFYVTLCYMMCL